MLYEVITVADVAPGPDSSNPTGFTPSGSLVYFAATQAQGTERWAPDWVPFIKPANSCCSRFMPSAKGSVAAACTASIAAMGASNSYNFV